MANDRGMQAIPEVTDADIESTMANMVITREEVPSLHVAGRERRTSFMLRPENASISEHVKDELGIEAAENKPKTTEQLKDKLRAKVQAKMYAKSWQVARAKALTSPMAKLEIPTPNLSAEERRFRDDFIIESYQTWLSFRNYEWPFDERIKNGQKPACLGMGEMRGHMFCIAMLQTMNGEIEHLDYEKKDWFQETGYEWLLHFDVKKLEPGTPNSVVQHKIAEHAKWNKIMMARAEKMVAEENMKLMTKHRS